MTTREKLIERIGSMSDAEVETLYARVPPRRLSHEKFEEGLEALRELSERLNLDVDAAALIREERDRHADRWP